MKWSTERTLAPSAPVQRFLFERAFDQAPPLPEPPCATVDVAEEPSFSAEDVARARQEGYDEGRDAAILDAKQQLEHSLLTVTTRLGENVAQLLAVADEMQETAGREALAIASAITERALPAYYAREGKTEVEALIRSLLPQLRDTPTIIVHVSEAQCDELSKQLEQVSATAGVCSRLIVSGNPALSAGDCRVEWPGGGAERNYQRLHQELDQIISNALTSAERRQTLASGEPHA